MPQASAVTDNEVLEQTPVTSKGCLIGNLPVDMGRICVC
jgi:hypothetical protein